MNNNSNNEETGFLEITVTDAQTDMPVADVDIEEAVVSGKKVILTTYGLSTRKQYTLKVSNIKSIDGVALKAQSKSFTNNIYHTFISPYYFFILF